MPTMLWAVFLTYTGWNEGNGELIPQTHAQNDLYGMFLLTHPDWNGAYCQFLPQTHAQSTMYGMFLLHIQEEAVEDEEELARWAKVEDQVEQEERRSYSCFCFHSKKEEDALEVERR